VNRSKTDQVENIKIRFRKDNREEVIIPREFSNLKVKVWQNVADGSALKVGRRIRNVHDPKGEMGDVLSVKKRNGQTVKMNVRFDQVERYIHKNDFKNYEFAAKTTTDGMDTNKENLLI